MSEVVLEALICWCNSYSISISGPRNSSFSFGGPQVNTSFLIVMELSVGQSALRSGSHFQWPCLEPTTLVL